MFEGLTSKARPFSVFFICPRCVSMFEGIASFHMVALDFHGLHSVSCIF
jgi:hypothetical protein